MTVKDIIDSVKDGNSLNAEKAFSAVMADKLSAALDSKRIETASSMIAGRKTEEDAQ